VGRDLPNRCLARAQLIDLKSAPDWSNWQLLDHDPRIGALDGVAHIVQDLHRTCNACFQANNQEELLYLP
jgi:hypothetical protein